MLMRSRHAFQIFTFITCLQCCVTRLVLTKTHSLNQKPRVYTNGERLSVNNDKHSKYDLIPSQETQEPRGITQRKLLGFSSLPTEHLGASGVDKNGASVLKSKAKDYEDDVEEDTDVDYDFGYTGEAESDSIYSFAHFRDELYNYVDEGYYLLNESFELTVENISQHIQKLEDRVEHLVQHLETESVAVTSQGGRGGELRIMAVDSTEEENGRARRGFLQIHIGGKWGFVCDDFFSDNAAKVACGQLGFPLHRGRVSIPDISANSAQLISEFSIVLDDVMCTGNESKLLDCRNAGLGKHDCDVDEAVVISC